MEYTNIIETVDAGGLSDFGRIDSGLRALVTSVEGTIPGSRGFGLSIEMHDLSPSGTRNEFAAELDEKIEEYLPEVRVSNIDYETSGGATTARIYIEANTDYEEAVEE